MLYFNQLVILFFIFAVLGWIMEVTLKFIQYHRFINRGFLIGPYCPIYGWGVVIISFTMGNFNHSLLTTFIAGALICGTLEYFTSFYLEKLFHARWWDYSTKPFNLHGRIWLGNVLLFGLAATLIVKFVNPRYFAIIKNFSDTQIKYAAITIMIIMLFDYGLSHFILNDVKKAIDGSDLDNTEEIAKAVRQILAKRGYLLKRIEEAYPNLKVRPKRIMQELKQAKKELRHIKKKIKATINNHELSTKLQNDYQLAVKKFNEFKAKHHI